jgi:hypothetical protein
MSEKKPANLAFCFYRYFDQAMLRVRKHFRKAGTGNEERSLLPHEEEEIALPLKGYGI